MISNEERREVAARLRALDVHDWNDFMDEVDSLETAIGCSIGQDWQDQDWWDRLADLIEPYPERTCKMTLDYEDEDWYCSECGGFTQSFNKPNYCVYCGAKVIDNE